MRGILIGRGDVRDRRESLDAERAMIHRLVAFALHQRFITLALAALLTAGGIASFYRLPIEAYPDVVDVEVDVITIWPGHAAEEVERLVTIALEKELNGVANLTFLRSISIFGLSNIRVLFADGTDSYWARQQVLERMAQAEIPADAKPQLGPLASVIGEVYRYTLESESMPLVELKALQDWTIEREFKKVPGVADIVSWGGGIKQYQISVDQACLRAYNLTLKQVFEAVAANNSNAGGSHVRQGEYALMVRGIGLIQSTGTSRTSWWPRRRARPSGCATSGRSGSVRLSASASWGRTMKTIWSRASS
jgi:heavy metal efflux system protein